MIMIIKLNNNNNNNNKQERSLIRQSNRFVGDQFEFISFFHGQTGTHRKQIHRWIAWFLHGFAITPDNSVQNALQLLEGGAQKRCTVMMEKNIQ